MCSMRRGKVTSYLLNWWHSQKEWKWDYLSNFLFIYGTFLPLRMNILTIAIDAFRNGCLSFYYVYHICIFFSINYTWLRLCWKTPREVKYGYNQKNNDKLKVRLYFSIIPSLSHSLFVKVYSNTVLYAPQMKLIISQSYSTIYYWLSIISIRLDDERTQ